ADRGRDGQQRDLGAGEAPDGVPVRVLGGGGAAAERTLRQDRGGARRARRAGHEAGRAATGAGACVRVRKTRARERADGPERGLPAQGKPRLSAELPSRVEALATE